MTTTLHGEAGSACEREEDPGPALEAADVGTWQWDIAAETLRFSRGVHGLLDVATGALGYHAFLACIHPDDTNRVDFNLRAGVAADSRLDLHFRARNTDRADRWLRMQGRPCEVGTGRSGARGTIAEDPSWASGEAARTRLTAIIASSDDAIVAKTLDGAVTDWNQGAEVTFGYAAAEMIGRPLAILVPPALENDETGILDRLMRGERVEHFETRRRRKDGAIIDVSLTASLLRDGSGRPVGALEIVRDITMAKRAQVALAEREAHLRSVLETVPDAMVVIDQRGLIRFVSATAEHLFGYAANEMVGCNVSSLMPMPYRAAHDGYLTRYLETGERRIIGIGRLIVG